MKEGVQMKTKVEYCIKCGERTVHKLVDRKTVADGCGIARAMLAVVSLGLSETVGADLYYQCSKCGRIREE